MDGKVGRQANLEKGSWMKRLGMVLALAALLMASGVALAATFNGTNEPDKIKGSTGNDRINGKAGDDVLKGRAGNDRMQGGTGKDRVIAGRGNDIVNTGLRDDRNPDFVNCGPGEDKIVRDRSKVRDGDTYKNCEGVTFRF